MKRDLEIGDRVVVRRDLEQDPYGCDYAGVSGKIVGRGGGDFKIEIYPYPDPHAVGARWFHREELQKVIAFWVKRLPAGSKGLDAYRLEVGGFFSWFNPETMKWQEATERLTETQAEKLFGLKNRGFVKN